MSSPIFVEILNHDGSVHSRQSFTQLPIRLGRAYDNDIILDDPHTAAEHAIIERNQLDELVLTDLGSLNGISRNHQREAFFVVQGGHIYQLGRTRLRIRTPDYAVAPEQLDDTDHRWEGWRPAATGLLLLSLVSLASNWLSDLQQIETTEHVLEVIYLLTAALAWSGLWALLGRLLSSNPRFGRQLLITSLALVAANLWDHLSGLVAYSLSWEWLANYSSHPGIALAMVALYFHLRTAGHKRPQRLKAYLVGLGLVISAVVLTKQYQSSKHFADELYLSNLYPPGLRLSGDQPREAFIQAMRGLQAEVDTQRDPKTDDKSGSDKH